MVERYGSYQTNALIRASDLRIVQVTGGGWNPPSGTVTVPVTVRGHPGQAAAGIVVWTESQETVAVIGGYVPASPPYLGFSAGSHPLSTEQLLDIANSLIGGA
jgi:hypothetical protein